VPEPGMEEQMHRLTATRAALIGVAVLATPLRGETHPPRRIVWAQSQRSIQTAEGEDLCNPDQGTNG